MMPAGIAAARAYLAPIQPAYWEWDEEHSAVAWLDGPTITLRQELAIALAPQVDRGLPPLPAVLILLAACRDSWPQSQSALVRIVSELSCTDRYLPPWISELFVKLELVHALARTSLATAERKGELLQYLFADQTNRCTSASDAKSIVWLLAVPGPIDLLHDIPPAKFDLWQLVGTLRGCLEKFDPAAFEAWAKTGIPQTLLPAEVDLTAGQRVRALLDELNEHLELGGVARLAKQLLAAITLPRPLAEPDDLPLGGVSDIANRGALDRLLLSELAHDDLTLAVRIATGEALYYRRETPPKSPPLRRTIVLDSGLRLWGLPRLFSTAVGLALCAAGDDKLSINTFRASGAQLLPTDLTCQAGLEQHLAALETNLHLGPTLPAIKTQCIATEATDNRPSDVVLITSDDALADDDFRQQLRAAGLGSTWIAAVNRQGRVRLLELGLRDMVLQREANFDLQTILSPPRKATPPLMTSDKAIPAFCRLQQCPLRLPHDLSVDRAWAIGEEGMLAIYKDYRLTWWNDPQFAPLLLAENMPRGRVHWADSRTSQMPYRAVVGTLSNRGLLAVQVWPREREVSYAQLIHNYSEQITTVTATAEHIFLIGPRRIIAFAWTGEELATSIDITGHISGRFFRSSDGKFIGGITCNGGRIGLTRGYAARPEIARRIIAIVGSSERPQALSDQGFVTDLIEGKDRVIVPPQYPRPLQLRAVSRDGERIVVQSSTTRGLNKPDARLLLLHIGNNTCREVHGIPELHVEDKVDKFLSRKTTLRQHLRGVYVTPRGDLALYSKKAQELTLEAGGHLILRDTGRSQVRQSALRLFEHVEAPSGYLLQRATWPDGSEAWLDSRGLLHLRSSNPQVPELSIVLHDGQTAGWSADSGAFGHAYFTGDHTRVATPPAVLRGLQSFIASLVMVEIA